MASVGHGRLLVATIQPRMTLRTDNMLMPYHCRFELSDLAATIPAGSMWFFTQRRKSIRHRRDSPHSAQSPKAVAANHPFLPYHRRFQPPERCIAISASPRWRPSLNGRNLVPPKTPGTHHHFAQNVGWLCRYHCLAYSALLIQRFSHAHPLVKITVLSDSRPNRVDKV